MDSHPVTSVADAVRSPASSLAISPRLESTRELSVAQPPQDSDYKPQLSFWEKQGARTASSASFLFSILSCLLFEHSGARGSAWCPLGSCSEEVQSTKNEAFKSQLLVFSVACFLFDGWVLTYHVMHPVHPKFMLARKRRMFMKVHIASGILNCLLGPFTFLMVVLDKVKYARYGSYMITVEGFLIHLPTSMYFVPTAFGAVRIMMPGFLHACVTYGYTLVRLATCRDEQIMEKLLSWWLLLHVYVFNRITFGILTEFNMMAKERYTVAILVGLAVCMPPSLGQMSMLFLLGSILTFNLVYLVAMDPDEHSTTDVFSAGGSANHAAMKRNTVMPEGAFGAGAPPPQQTTTFESMTREYSRLGVENICARYAFDTLDIHKSGYLDMEELADLLVGWGLPASESADLMKELDVNGDGKLEYEEFEKNLTPVWKFVANIHEAGAHLTPGVDHAHKSIQKRDKARILAAETSD